ncbi:GDSL-type esterase/lipase family protein [Novosphingobium sp.]|uniref:SGNH/GDSL hydrolase family protein n=1 Tax=Novosphingobium sp. TaxID=1874826 RepID=UPI0038BB308B
MAQKIIGTGAAANDGTGDTIRDGAIKANANFAELYQFSARQTKKAALAGRAFARQYTRKPSSYILDKLAGAAVGAYGFKKLRAAYAGQCCNVRRVSDSATLDIPFKGDGVVDTDLMIAFAGASTLKLVTLYDQTANGYNLTQATAGNQPDIELSYLIGGMPTFSGGTGLTIPAGLQITSTANFSAWMAMANSTSRVGQRVWTFGTTGQCDLELTPVSAFSVQPYVNGTALHFGNPNMATIPASNGQVIGLNSAATGMTFYRGAYSSARAAAAVFAPAAGGTFNNSGTDAQAFVVFNAALSTADVLLMQYGLASEFSSVVSPRANVVLVGDSIVQGVISYGYNYNKTLWDYLPETVEIHNVGQSGQYLQAEASEVTSYVTGLYKAGIPNVAVLLGGVNDIQVGGRTAAQLQADATTWATAVKAAGFKALIGTLYPRAVTGGYTAAMETVRVAHNAWIRANSGPSLTFDDLSDFELEPTFLPTISAADFPDNLHPGLAGYRKADPILADAILRNLPGI